MTEEIDPSIIQHTKDCLSPFITKPPLTDKLLRKPPFKFLHDLISEITRQHGLFSGLFTDHESHYENIKDKESKMAFLQKVVDVMEFMSGERLAARPGKVVAGLEVLHTNSLLQAIGTALSHQKDSSEAVAKVLSGEKFGAKKTSKSREHKSSKSLSSVQTKHREKKETSRDKDGKRSLSRPRSRERAAPPAATAAAAATTEPAALTGDVTSQKRGEVSRDRQEDRRRKESTKRDKDVKSSVEAGVSVGDTGKPDPQSLNVAIESVTAADNPAVKHTSDAKRSSRSDHRSSDGTAKKEKLPGKEEKSRRRTTHTESVTNGKETAKEKSSKKERESKKDKSSKKDKETKKDKESKKLGKSTGEKLDKNSDGRLRHDEQLTETSSAVTSTARDIHVLDGAATRGVQPPLVADDFVPLKDQTAAAGAARPGTGAGRARPGSARAAPPLSARARSRVGAALVIDQLPAADDTSHQQQPEQLVATAESVPSAAIILDRPTAGVTVSAAGGGDGSDHQLQQQQQQQEEEDSHFDAAVEQSTDTLSGGMSALQSGEGMGVVAAAGDGEHGRLVSQIIETKRTMEQQVGAKQEEADGYLTDDSHYERQRREILKLLDCVQNVTKAANPLGKMMDFLQEDADAMKRELNTWRQERLSLTAQIQKEKEKTEESLQPLTAMLSELQSSVDEQCDKIGALRGTVVSTGRRIDKLLDRVVNAAQ